MSATRESLVRRFFLHPFGGLSLLIVLAIFVIGVLAHAVTPDPEGWGEVLGSILLGLYLLVSLARHTKKQGKKVAALLLGVLVVFVPALGFGYHLFTVWANAQFEAPADCQQDLVEIEGESGARLRHPALGFSIPHPGQRFHRDEELEADLRQAHARSEEGPFTHINAWSASEQRERVVVLLLTGRPGSNELDWPLFTRSFRQSAQSGGVELNTLRERRRPPSLELSQTLEGQLFGYTLLRGFQPPERATWYRSGWYVVQVSVMSADPEPLRTVVEGFEVTQ